MKSPILRLIRPKQWVKNVFVFLPLFFGGSLLDAPRVVAVVLVFLAFCLVASSVYCLNDIVDADDDRRHPAKCHRPVAAGLISKRKACGLMVVLLLLGVAMVVVPPLSGAGLWAGGWAVCGVVVAYWLMSAAYCVWLKNYAIVDVCIVAAGFVLRVLAGGVSAGVALSRWIVLMTFLLTLFLSLAKRRDDVVRMQLTGEAPRRNTSRYNLTFINQAITITASVTLVCYTMYTVSPEVVARFHTQHLYLTTVFVLIGLLRYLQIAVVDEQSGDPTKIILHDRPIQLVVLAWLLSFLVIIYL